MRFIQINNIVKEQYKGKVYDLTVEDTHSYNIEGAIVHNSGAGSLVNYALGITQINPLQYDLIFERFLNPDRGHLPDIDSDFSPIRGSEVFEHLNELYGKENCCNIITFSNLQAKSIVKDICRCFEIPIAEANTVCKYIPSDIKKFSEVLEITEVKHFFDNHPQIYKHCEKLFGSPRQNSQHPAGIAVLPFPVTDIMPVCNAKPTINGLIGQMAQFEKEQVEMVGAVKLDILRLQQLDIIQHQTSLIKEFYGDTLDMNNLPMDDTPTWDLLCNCDTLGIFQMESEIGKGIIRKIQPRNLEELSSINAFIRPGTSGLDNYVLAKKDIRKKKLYHPIIDKILEPTYGSIIYQETIMSLISEMMGMSFGKADILRRALEKPTKKGNAEKVQYFQDNVVKLGMEHGISKKACEQIKQDILDNAGYLFNKSHSIAYSYVTYEMAYLKANYPLVFYLSALTFEGTDKLQAYMMEARRKGITILPPSVMKSQLACTIEDKDKKIIRAGFGLIKGMGEKTIEEIVASQSQDITTLNDYLSKANSKAVSKSALTLLIKMGAMEELPFKIDREHIDESKWDNLIPINDEQVLIPLNRLQQELWLNEYLDLKATKTVSKYAVPMDIIKGRYLQEFDEGDIVVEKDNTVIVPEPMLYMIGLTEDDVLDYKTPRKMPKGIFKASKEKKLDKEIRAFINVMDNMTRVVVDKKQQYFDDLREFEISFIPHPLTVIADKIPRFETFREGQVGQTAGIITAIETRSTKTGKPFYTITLSTPHENVKLTVWNECMKAYYSELQLGNVIKVKGKASQQYGSITVDQVAFTKQ